MNNLIFLKKMMVFTIVSCCFFFNINKATGQLMKLTKDLSDGNLTIATGPILCDILSASSSHSFQFWNDFDESITIQSLSITTNPENQHSYQFSPLIIPALTLSPTLNVLFENPWGEVTIDGTIEFTFELSYIYNGEAENDGENSLTVHYATFKRMYHVCPDDLPIGSSIGDYIWPSAEGLNIKKRPRMAQSENPSLTISPNPIKNNFLIKYSLAEESKVNISIYNSLGKEVKSIINNELQSEGQHIINESLSENLPSGIYYVISKIEDTLTTEKLIKL